MQPNPRALFVARAAASMFALGACVAAPPPHPDPQAVPLSSEPGPAAAPTAPTPAVTPPPPAEPKREYPFDPSPNDRPSLEVAGFTGAAPVPAESGYERGIRVFAVKPGGAAESAGMRGGDLLVEFSGVSFPTTMDDPIGALRKRLVELPPESDADIAWWRDGTGVMRATIHLGRQPPPFASLPAPVGWFQTKHSDAAITLLIDEALALDGGAERYADTLARNGKHLEKKDPFRLREMVEAHLHLDANEAIARRLTDAVGGDPHAAILIAAGSPDMPARAAADDLSEASLEVLVARIETMLAAANERIAKSIASWSAADREEFTKSFARLRERVEMAEYLYDDEDVGRERAGRRTVALLARVDVAEIARAATETAAALDVLLPRLAEVAGADPREGLLAERDTPYGRIEIWGRGNQRHTRRCAFRFDVGGNDNWLDVGGRADLTVPVSIEIDWAGNDLYGASAPGCQGGALVGLGWLLDLGGDDQYLARSWSQGVGVAGYGLLQDLGGRDVYHGQDVCQGVGLQGAGVLADDDGDDIYTGVRLCQGVGLAGGVGALRDWQGNDRYVCTGRYDSEYGEAGLFSGWGQGTGYGFRNVTSGGIGMLHDRAGDDVYEAGNFSQGGGYFYAWGIARDDAGQDRWIGSRYAQGWAAHEATGTFIEGGGDDVYQSHSSVADGLSWDETSVVFHDLAGNDVYEQGGFSLAAAAHNGMVLFLDDSGDDRYPEVPAKASSNEYHGGHSFALFADLGGADTYGATPMEDWNTRVSWRHDGAYFVDLPMGRVPLREFARPER